MNETVGKVRIGQWYLRRDKGESFLVIGVDARGGGIAIQTFDGEIDEIDADAWNALPLELAEPPEDWSGPFDVDPVAGDLGETDLTAEEWSAPLEQVRTGTEAWEDRRPEDERDPWDEGAGIEEPLADHPQAATRAG